MGVTRGTLHKRKATGGRKKAWRKKKKYDMGRPSANTKLSSANITIRPVRVRGGNMKYRALRLDSGCFAWPSEACTKKTRIVDVVYHPNSNELVRTKSLTKSAVVQVDANPFKQWYQKQYGVELGVRSQDGGLSESAPDFEKLKETISEEELKKLKIRYRARRPVDQHVSEQMITGRLMAVISSRPGQTGRADGYILEGKELEFYIKKSAKKKGKAAAE